MGERLLAQAVSHQSLRHDRWSGSNLLAALRGGPAVCEPPAAEVPYQKFTKPLDNLKGAPTALTDSTTSLMTVSFT